MYYDQLLFSALHYLADRAALLDWLLVFTAQYLPYLLVLSMFVALVRVANGVGAREWRTRIYFAATAILAAVLSRGIITEAIRFFYDRPRPYEALGFEPLLANGSGSFPSGHMALLFALGAALFFYHRKRGSWFLAASLLTGFARIATGVHWPSDILGGALIGVVAALLVQWLLAPVIRTEGGTRASETQDPGVS